MGEGSEEARWGKAIAMGRFGVWDLAPQREEVRYSTLWKARMGFPGEHAPDSTAFWRCRVHPDDLAAMLDTLRAHLDGSTPTYECRFRLRSNGSGYRSVLSRGRVVERDRRGDALRMVGTMIDQTERPVRLLRARLHLHGTTDWNGGCEGPSQMLAADPWEFGSQAKRPCPAGARIAAGRARMLDLVHDLLDVAHRDSAARP